MNKFKWELYPFGRKSNIRFFFNETHSQTHTHVRVCLQEKRNRERKKKKTSEREKKKKNLVPAVSTAQSKANKPSKYIQHETWRKRCAILMCDAARFLYVQRKMVTHFFFSLASNHFYYFFSFSHIRLLCELLFSHCFVFSVAFTSKTKIYL